MKSIEFVVPGPPVYNQRHRSAVRGNRSIQYDPVANVKAKAHIKTVALAHLNGNTTVPFPDGPLSVMILAYFPLPKSYHRKRTPRPARPHDKRPDADNVAKIYLDALNGVVWHDDSQIASLQVLKIRCAQGDIPRTEIQVRDLVLNLQEEVN